MWVVTLMAGGPGDQRQVCVLTYLPCLHRAAGGTVLCGVISMSSYIMMECALLLTIIELNGFVTNTFITQYYCHKHK